MGVEEYRLPITSTDVVSHTPHDYSGTFQGGCSARFTDSRRALNRSRRALNPSKQPREGNASLFYTKCSFQPCLSRADCVDQATNTPPCHLHANTASAVPADKTINFETHILSNTGPTGTVQEMSKARPTHVQQTFNTYVCTQSMLSKTCSSQHTQLSNACINIHLAQEMHMIPYITCYMHVCNYRCFRDGD